MVRAPRPPPSPSAATRASSSPRPDCPVHAAADGPRATTVRCVSTARDLLDVALQAVPGAQVREGQHVMAEAVEASLKRGEHLLVQAGTGTGKSLAYLVPALASGKKVVVATATKALQAQLVDKDLPRLADALEPALGHRPTYPLAKGRSNYLCLQQLNLGPGMREPEQDELWDGPTSMIGQQV